MRTPALTATVWGGAAMLAGAATTFALSVPFRPSDADGLEALGWGIVVLGLCAAVALVAGAVAVHQGLRRSGAPHPGLTTAAFVPTALLLGGFTIGVGAFAAPAVAHWLVDGFVRRSGWGPRPSGLAQRLVLTVVACALLVLPALGPVGHELGGHVHGALLTWVAVLPAVVLPPVLLLARRVPWRLLAGGTAVAAGLLALAVPQAVRDAHPTPARLQQMAEQLPVPAGHEVVEVRTSVTPPEPWEVPVTVLTARGGAAAAWEDVLAEQGWVRSGEADPYWLPADLQQRLAGHPQYERGPWVRATVVPQGDGALVVLSSRP